MDPRVDRVRLGLGLLTFGPIKPWIYRHGVIPAGCCVLKGTPSEGVSRSENGKQCANDVSICRLRVVAPLIFMPQKHSFFSFFCCFEFELLKVHPCWFAPYKWRVEKVGSWYLCWACQPCSWRQRTDKMSMLTAMFSQLSNVDLKQEQEE